MKAGFAYISYRGEILIESMTIDPKYTAVWDEKGRFKEQISVDNS